MTADRGGTAASISRRIYAFRPYNRMQMQLGSEAQIPDGLLAANALLGENSHQGVPTYTHALYQGFGFVISNTALGLKRSLYDEGVQSRYTGKERDTESGLDYFGARYYASNMGRWMSPDWADKPEAVPYSDLDNPQSLNLYGYVNNNPLSKADKDGHCAEDACIVEGSVAAVAFGALVVSSYLAQPANQRSLSIAASSAATTISDTFHSIFSKSDSSAKAPPNPNGSKGAPDHQATADEEAAKMGPNGQREVRVDTPGGSKGTRVIDAAKVENGKVTEATQVVRPNKNGTPPAREVRAAKDIQDATGVKPKLVPVRPLPNQ